MHLTIDFVTGKSCWRKTEISLCTSAWRSQSSLHPEPVFDGDSPGASLAFLLSERVVVNTPTAAS